MAPAFIREVTPAFRVVSERRDGIAILVVGEVEDILIALRSTAYTFQRTLHPNEMFRWEVAEKLPTLR